MSRFSVSSSLKTNGFAMIPLSEELACSVGLLSDQASQFFANKVAMQDVQSLNHLNEVGVHCYTGTNNNLFDEFGDRTVSPNRQAIHLSSGGYLAGHYFQQAEALRGTTLLRNEGNQATFIGLAYSLLLELVQFCGSADELERALGPCLEGCVNNSRLSIYNSKLSSSADQDLVVQGPANIGSGFLTLCYVEGEGLEVQHPASKRWQVVGCRGCLVVMAGYLLSTISEGTYYGPSCLYQLRSQAHHPSLVFALLPSLDANIKWPLRHCMVLSSRVPKRRQAGELMEKADKLTTELNQGQENVPSKPALVRTGLVAEIMSQQQLWVALMMGLHPRLGAKSLHARCRGVPTEVWKMVCIDAMGFNLEVSVDVGSCVIQKITAYSALKEVPVISVLAPAFGRSQLNFRRFTLSLAGKAVKRYQTVVTQCLSCDTADTGIMAVPSAANNKLLVCAAGQDCHLLQYSLWFSISPQTRFGRLQQAFCSYAGLCTLSEMPVRFEYRGQQIWSYHTPKCLGLEDQGVIKAHAMDDYGT